MKKSFALLLLLFSIALFSIKSSFAIGGKGRTVSREVDGFVGADGKVYCTGLGNVTCVIYDFEEIQ